jgi:hypothetical protein
LTRISLYADRNADNPQKISDKLSGNIGFSVNLSQIGVKTPLGVNISGSINGLAASTGTISPYSVPEDPWIFNNSGINCDFTHSPRNLQFKSRLGYSKNAKKEEKWEFSFSTAARFKNGRLSLKTMSSDFPDKWKWTVSWRLETDK